MNVSPTTISIQKTPPLTPFPTHPESTPNVSHLSASSSTITSSSSTNSPATHSSFHLPASTLADRPEQRTTRLVRLRRNGTRAAFLLRCLTALALAVVGVLAPGSLASAWRLPLDSGLPAVSRFQVVQRGFHVPHLRSALEGRLGCWEC